MTKLYRLVAVTITLLIAPLGARAQSPTLSPEATQGQVIAFDRLKGNCLACHTMRGGDVPSNVGPILENMKVRYPNKADLIAILTDETQRNPQTIMPPFGRNRILTPHEIDLIVAFLYTL
jgi:sulfur-oxidizing protein SoxX